jgi:hypothetical protein
MNPMNAPLRAGHFAPLHLYPPPQHVGFRVLAHNLGYQVFPALQHVSQWLTCQTVTRMNEEAPGILRANR